MPSSYWNPWKPRRPASRRRGTICIRLPSQCQIMRTSVLSIGSRQRAKCGNQILSSDRTSTSVPRESAMSWSSRCSGGRLPSRYARAAARLFRQSQVRLQGEMPFDHLGVKRVGHEVVGVAVLAVVERREADEGIAGLEDIGAQDGLNRAFVLQDLQDALILVESGDGSPKSRERRTSPYAPPRPPARGWPCRRGRPRARRSWPRARSLQIPCPPS